VNGTGVIELVVFVAIIVGFIYLLRRGDVFGSSTPGVAPEPEPSGPPPATLIRVYRGHNQQDAVAAMQADATALSAQGYEVTAQSWAPGSYGCGAFLVALILFIVLIGILVFLYMLFVKPDGTLTVTYTLRGTSPAPVPPGAMGDLERLGQLLASGVLTQAEFDAKKAQLLERM
jgi:NADH:ubiquinone oxidoreductase subunit 3 (subunit A)